MKSTRNPGRSELICKLYESGKSIKMIAEIVGLSGTTVQYYLKRNNVVMRPAHRIASGTPRYIPHPRKLKVDAEELRKLVAKGTRVVEMCKLKSKRRISGKAIMEQKRIDEARLEAEHRAAEEAARREEEARIAAETSIREILVACGLPSEIHIETSAQGNAILANMKNRFTAAAAAA